MTEQAATTEQAPPRATENRSTTPRSTAFATQLATKEWHSRLGGDTIADAILDRIVHNTVWIDTGEFNMRQRHGQSMLES